ncbi:hypothetical protein [Clostridium tyrobutyricum]|nr:hypothetical protein [Clostridium tyrobutyricum]
MEIHNKIRNYDIGVLVATKDGAIIMNESGYWNMNNEMKDSL